MSAWAAATRARCSAESSTTSTAPFFTGWPSLNSSVSMRPSISGRSTTLSSAISAPTALTVLDTGEAVTFIMLTGMKGGPPAWAKARSGTNSRMNRARMENSAEITEI